MSVTLEQRAFDLVMAGQSVDDVGYQLGVSEATVQGAARDLALVPTVDPNATGPVTQEQRIFDLAMAGHSVDSIAYLLGVTEQTVKSALHNFALSPSLTNIGATGAAGAVGPSPWTAATVWTSGTVGVVGPPATLVTRTGHTYVCTTAASAGIDPATDAGAHWTEIV